MKDNKVLVYSISISLLVLVSLIIFSTGVFGGAGDVASTAVRIITPMNNSVICCANYTLRTTIDSGNSTFNITWFIAPAGTQSFTRLNGTARATTAALGGGTNETANGTDLDVDFSTALMKLNGLYDIIASFNNTNTSAFITNYTIYNITIDNIVPGYNYTRRQNNTELTNNTLLTNDTSIHTYITAANGTNNGTVGGSGNATVSVIAVLNSSATANKTIYMTIDRSNTPLSKNGANFSGTIDASTIGDGIYDLTIYIFKNVSSQGTGSRGNASAISVKPIGANTGNTTITNITIDAVAPDVTLTKVTTADTIDVFGTMEYKCVNVDTINGGLTYEVTITKPDGSTVTKTSTGDFTAKFTNTDTNIAGTYSVKCTVTEDGYAKHSTTKQSTGDVSGFNAQYSGDGGTPSSGGGGGGGSSGSGTTSGGVFVHLDLSKGNGQGTLSGTQGVAKKFSLDGKAAHTITFTNVAADLLTLTIASTPQTVDLKVGEKKTVTVDEGDVEVTLDGITNGKADVTLTKLGAALTPEEVAEEVEGTTTSGGEEGAVTGEPRSSAALWTTIIIIIIVVIVAFVAMRKRR
ncbi:MAG: hypothetical protein HYS32_02585 [Candidatus Woesearchaeota archaeon]|nr:MAG: hypothetical protein HYS32_02585 [Candidatus Woesearchaeota archaeon]